MILELSHVILDHTHQGMHIYPTAMVAALLLQHRDGLERSEQHSPDYTYMSLILYDIMCVLDDLMHRLKWLKSQVILRGARVHWERGWSCT